MTLTDSKGPLTDEELTTVEKLVDFDGPVTSDKSIIARMAVEIRAHRRTLVGADDLILAASALGNADLGRLRRAVNSLVRGDSVDELITVAVALSDSQLGLLRRFVNGEFENRIRFTKGLTEDEQQIGRAHV